MFLGEFFKNYFLCKQFEPDQARHNTVRPRSASCADPNVWGGGGEKDRTPSKISQNIAFLQLVWTPEKSQSYIFMYDQYPHSSETSFKWRFVGWPMMARL